MVRGTGAVVALVCLTTTAPAQVVPDAEWRTIRTPHFSVHFTPDVEEIARRAAVIAESAYVALSAELRPPRGPLDLVVADNVDFSNGSATPFPTNRIILYARPPVDVQSLRFYDDWTTILVTHELTHIFHLDRARGWWGVAQQIFGRNPALMPNLYLPSWVKEGIAVYYETRLTGSGRLLASQNAMVARAAAGEGRLPALGQLSLTSPTFLGGEIAYTYGALAMAEVSRARGDSAIPRFVEATSRGVLPFRLDAAARRAFGAPLSGIWERWRDSVQRVTTRQGEPIPSWSELTRGGWAVQSPRWLPDGDLIYAANTGREVPGAYRLDPLTGEVRRIGRRNALEPNVPLATGGILFAQPDYVGPFTIRSDLWIQDEDGERRLTTGARLTRPDARADGQIVAVQGLAGATRLVRLDAAGRLLARFTEGSPDEQWTEPRWSPDGQRIAAIRRTRPGLAEVVVLDTLGVVTQVLARDRAVIAAPSWAADGRSVLYSSDREGRTQHWRAWLPGAGPAGLTASVDGVVRQRLSDAETGLFFPEPSPDGERLAGIHFRADGYHLGVAPLPEPREAAVPPALLPARTLTGPLVTTAAPAVIDSSPARPYSPWRMLVPRYWTPLVVQGGGGGLAFGGLTSGSDPVGRHAWSASASIEPDTRFVDADAAWRYAGLGLPFVDVAFTQRWDRDRFTFRDGEAGTLDERTRRAFAGLTFFRPGFRSSSSLSMGVDVEAERLVPRSARVEEALDEEFRGTRLTPGVRLAGRWSNAQHPALAVSPEDGVTAGLSLRQRWLDTGGGSTTRSAVGTAAGYRALSLGGFAHHVIAVRLAGGWQDERATSAFDAGGLDGGSLDLLPGLPLGAGSRPFGVRGFAPTAQEGTIAAAGTVEWRAPLAVIGRSLGRLPLFFDRSSVVAFGDVGSAWCASGDLDASVCRESTDGPRWMTSAGAEFVLDAAPVYDLAYRFRAGIAVPLRTAGTSDPSPISAYLTVGRSF